MPVYTYRMMEKLNASLSSMAATMFSKMPLIITGEEFLAAFVDPDHVPMLKQVQEICRPAVSGYAHTVLHGEDGEQVNVTLQFGGTAPVILPQYVRHGLQPTCPQNVREMITSWVAERIRLGRAFGDAQDALAYLNDNCGDVEAMTIMLRCLPTIMAGISADGESKTNKKAQKLTSIKRFGALPRVHRQVTQRLAEVSAIVSSTTLMQEAPIPTVPRHAASFSATNVSNSGRFNIFYLDGPMQKAPPASFL